MDGINPRFTSKTSLPSELFLLPLHAIAAVLKSHRDYIAPTILSAEASDLSVAV